MLNKKQEIFFLVLIIACQIWLAFIAPNTFVVCNLLLGIFGMAIANKFEEIPYYARPTSFYLTIYAAYLWIKFEEKTPIWWAKFKQSKFAQSIRNKFDNLLKKSIAQ